MIEIQLNLFVTLAPYLPANADALPVRPGTTLDVLIRELKIPENAVKLAFVNGARKPLSHVLAPGDRVGLFPPVGGG